MGENSRSDATSMTDVTSETWTVQQGEYGTKVYSSVRRFVVVATKTGHSNCVSVDGLRSWYKYLLLTVQSSHMDAKASTSLAFMQRIMQSFILPINLPKTATRMWTLRFKCKANRPDTSSNRCHLSIMQRYIQLSTTSKFNSSDGLTRTLKLTLQETSTMSGIAISSYDDDKDCLAQFPFR